MPYFLVDASKTEGIANADKNQQLSGWRKWTHQLNPAQMWKNTFAANKGMCNILATTLTTWILHFG